MVNTKVATSILFDGHTKKTIEDNMHIFGRALQAGTYPSLAKLGKWKVIADGRHVDERTQQKGRRVASVHEEYELSKQVVRFISDHGKTMRLSGNVADQQLSLVCWLAKGKPTPKKLAEEQALHYEATAREASLKREERERELEDRRQQMREIQERLSEAAKLKRVALQFERRMAERDNLARALRNLQFACRIACRIRRRKLIAKELEQQKCLEAHRSQARRARALASLVNDTAKDNTAEDENETAEDEEAEEEDWEAWAD